MVLAPLEWTISISFSICCARTASERASSASCSSIVVSSTPNASSSCRHRHEACPNMTSARGTDSVVSAKQHVCLGETACPALREQGTELALTRRILALRRSLATALLKPSTADLMSETCIRLRSTSRRGATAGETGERGDEDEEKG